MDLSFIALLLYKRRKFKECKEKCDQILEQDPSNQVKAYKKNASIIEKKYCSKLFQSCWLLKMKAVTAEVYVDHIDIDETSKVTLNAYIFELHDLRKFTFASSNAITIFLTKGLADLVSDTPSMAVSNKPKTSLQQKPVTGKTTSFGLRFVGNYNIIIIIT